MNGLLSLKSSGEESFVAEMNSKDEYDTDDRNDGDDSLNGTDDPSSKKRRLNDDEKLQRCRERNRIHARNTRERKRAQMDLMQLRIQELSDEKTRLENYEPEASVASILMSLSNNQMVEPKLEGNTDDIVSTFAADTIERIKSQISATLSDDEELEINSDILGKDKTGCSTAELEMIRRERNRMHAKKTRLRKKKMLGEMETIIFGLEQDIHGLREKHSLGPGECVGTGEGARLSSTMTIGSGGAAGVSKFTGFRHVHRSDSMSSGKVVSSAVRKDSFAAQAATTQAVPSPRNPAFPSSLMLPAMHLNTDMSGGPQMHSMGMGMSVDVAYLQALVAHALPAMDGDGSQSQSLSQSQGNTTHGGSSRSSTSRNGSSGDLSSYYNSVSSAVAASAACYPNPANHMKSSNTAAAQAPSTAPAQRHKHKRPAGSAKPEKSAPDATTASAVDDARRGLSSGNTSRCNSSDSDGSPHSHSNDSNPGTSPGPCLPDLEGPSSMANASVNPRG